MCRIEWSHSGWPSSSPQNIGNEERWTDFPRKANACCWHHFHLTHEHHQSFLFGGLSSWGCHRGWRPFCVMGSGKTIQGYKIYRKRSPNFSKSVMRGYFMDGIYCGLSFRDSYSYVSHKAGSSWLTQWLLTRVSHWGTLKSPGFFHSGSIQLSRTL